MIPEILKSIAGSLARFALTGIGAYLVNKGAISGDQLESLIVGAGIALAALAWSLYQKYKSRLHFLAALAAPPTSSEADVKSRAQSRNTTVWALVLLLLPMSMGARDCGEKESKDALYGVARALHRVANATARADEVTHRFYLDGIVSADEAETISLVLADINRASAEFQRIARGYTTFDAATQIAILQYASDARDYIIGRIADGTARIKNERARDEWRAIINTAHDAFTSIVSLVRSAKPKPTPRTTGTVPSLPTNIKTVRAIQ